MPNEISRLNYSLTLQNLIKTYNYLINKIYNEKTYYFFEVSLSFYFWWKLEVLSDFWKEFLPKFDDDVREKF